MGSQGMRSSANYVWTRSSLLSVFLLFSMITAALAVQRATYVVGGDKQWAAPGLANTYNATYLQDWANSIVFMANDTLGEYMFFFLFSFLFFCDRRLTCQFQSAGGS